MSGLSCITKVVDRKFTLLPLHCDHRADENSVYDITDYLEDHPGGVDLLIGVAGKDATQVFEDVGHSDEARELLEDLLVGQIPVSVGLIPFGTSITATGADQTGKGTCCRGGNLSAGFRSNQSNYSDQDHASINVPHGPDVEGFIRTMPSWRCQCCWVSWLSSQGMVGPRPNMVKRLVGIRPSVLGRHWHGIYGTGTPDMWNDGLGVFEAGLCTGHLFVPSIQAQTPRHAL